MNRIIDIQEVVTPLSPAESSPASSEKGKDKLKFKLKTLPVKTEPANFMSNLNGS